MDGKKNGGPVARVGNLTEIDDDVAQGDDPENEEADGDGGLGAASGQNSGNQVVNVLHDYRQTKAF